MKLTGGPGDDYIRAAGPRSSRPGTGATTSIFGRAVWVAGHATEAASLSGGVGQRYRRRPPGNAALAPTCDPTSACPAARATIFCSATTAPTCCAAGSGRDRLGGFTRGVMDQRLARSRNAAARASTSLRRQAHVRRARRRRPVRRVRRGSPERRSGRRRAGRRDRRRRAARGARRRPPQRAGRTRPPARWRWKRRRLRRPWRRRLRGRAGMGHPRRSRRQGARQGRRLRSRRQDRFIAGIRDVAKRVALRAHLPGHRPDRARATSAARGPRCRAAPWPASGSPSVGTPIRGCERLALAPLSVTPRGSPGTGEPAPNSLARVRKRDPRRLIARRREARERVQIVHVPDVGASADGSVTTRQEADVTLPRAELERIWQPGVPGAPRAHLLALPDARLARAAAGALRPRLARDRPAHPPARAPALQRAGVRDRATSGARR